MAGRNGRTVRDLRRANRTAVLQRLYFEGPLSRFELGPATGLSQVVYDDYQHNRNPFIDHPEWVESIW
ncbi:hypothetical protein, partial [Streptomyces tendae]